MNIVLLGFMGTGKTSVAKTLAESLKMHFVEMDSVIEEKQGMNINEIFAKKGEPYFRKAESEVVRELCSKDGLVISGGGGVVLNPDNIKELEKNGILICLFAVPEEIYNRVKDEGHRPLLNVEEPLKKIRDLLDYRRPYYNRIPIQIDTTGKTILEVVNKIKKIIATKTRRHEEKLK